MARLCRVRVDIFLGLLCDGDGITVVVSSLGSHFLKIRMDHFQCELQADFATVFKCRLQNSGAMMKDPGIDVMLAIGLLFSELRDGTPKSDAEIDIHEAVLNPECQAMAMRDVSFLYCRRKRCTIVPTRQETRYQNHHQG